MVPIFPPQLVSNDGLSALRAAIAAPSRYPIEPKVDGVRASVTIATRPTAPGRAEAGPS